jgi:hypothetical protein
VIGRYAVLAGRVRQELSELERVVDRVERAMQARHTAATERDLLLDAAALNLHDVYSGLERIFAHIASDVDQSVPSGPDWHRELLRQMTVDLPGLRPRVLTVEMAASVEEYLRFRHVVRHVYAFELDPERVERLAGRLRPTFHTVSTTLVAFTAFLDGLARDA